MDGLISCIGGIPEGQKPEHIVVTGDIAWFGKRDEYDEAYEYRNICDYEAPIQEYEQFCQDLGVEPYKYYVDGKVEYSYSAGYKDVTFSYGNVVRLVGFNTSLLSYGKKLVRIRCGLGSHKYLI